MRAKPSICLLLETSKRLRHCVASHRRILPVLTCCLPFAHSGLSRFAYNGRYAKRLVARCVPPPPIRFCWLVEKQAGVGRKDASRKAAQTSPIDRRSLLIATALSMSLAICSWSLSTGAAVALGPLCWSDDGSRPIRLAGCVPSPPKASTAYRQTERQAGYSSPIRREQTSALPDKPNTAAPNPNTSVTWSDCVPESIVSSPSSGWHWIHPLRRYYSDLF